MQFLNEVTSNAHSEGDKQSKCARVIVLKSLRKHNEHNDTSWQSLYRELVEKVIVLITNW